MSSDFKNKANNLPQQVKEVLLSNKIAEEIHKIATSYKLSNEQRIKTGRIVGLIFVNDVPLSKLPELLQQQAALPETMAAGVASNIVKAVFLPLKDFFRDAQMLTGYWSQKSSPPTNKPESLNLEITKKAGYETENSKTKAQLPQISKKPFRQAVHENKEILNQPLTAQPIKIPDFDQPVRPTIKNWLSDYIKQKGTGHHDELERGDYLYKSPNAQNLPPKERLKLAVILKAYDEDIEMPISPETGLILIEDLLKKEVPLKTPAPAAPQVSAVPSPQATAEEKLEWSPMTPPAGLKFYSPSPAAAPTPPIPPPAPSGTEATKPPALAPDYSRAGQPRGSDTYREPVEEEDLVGPIKPPPVRSAPRLDGNIVDLKNFENHQ